MFLTYDKIIETLDRKIEQICILQDRCTLNTGLSNVNSDLLIRKLNLTRIVLQRTRQDFVDEKRAKEEMISKELHFSFVQNQGPMYSLAEVFNKFDGEEYPSIQKFIEVQLSDLLFEAELYYRTNKKDSIS